VHQDDRELLDESAIVARALASPAAGRLPEGTTARLVHEWWSLCAWLPG